MIGSKTITINKKEYYLFHLYFIFNLTMDQSLIVKQLFDSYKSSSDAEQKSKHILNVADYLAQQNIKIDQFQQLLSEHEKLDFIVDVFRLCRDDHGLKLCEAMFGDLNRLFFWSMDHLRHNLMNRMTKTYFGNLFRENVVCDLFYNHVLQELQITQGQTFYKNSMENFCVSKRMSEWFEEMENIYKDQITTWYQKDKKHGFKTIEWALYKCFFCVLTRFISCNTIRKKMEQERTSKNVWWSEFIDKCHSILCFMEDVFDCEGMCDQIKFFLD